LLAVDKPAGAPPPIGYYPQPIHPLAEVAGRRSAFGTVMAVDELTTAGLQLRQSSQGGRVDSFPDVVTLTRRKQRRSAV
jgi:hypothetical protein